VIQEDAMKKPHRGVRPIRVLPLSFLIIIGVGTLLLMLPISSADRVWLPFTDALFTATSASCVTGLIVRDTGTYFSAFGQAVILTLIQLGGLGFMTMTTILFALTGRRISLHDRMAMAEGLGESRLQGIVRLCRGVLMVTGICELAGIVLLCLRFIPQFGLDRGLWVSVFTSISAFCNAGFDLMGNYTSLTNYANDPYVLLVVAMLIIIGGLGFGVVLSLSRNRRFSKLKLHGKLVIIGTAFLLLTGTLSILILEYGNPATLGGMPFFQKLYNAFFQSVTLRTAGFNSFDQLSMTDATKGVGILLMLVGGSPAGTAGGLKVTTVMVLGLSVYSYIRGRHDTTALGRTIPREQTRRALTLFFCAISFLVMLTIVMSAWEGASAVGQLGIWNMLYEATSALCTVGISVGISGAAGTLTQMLLVLMMYVGRVGLLTVAFAITSSGHPEAIIRFPEEEVMIG